MIGKGKNLSEAKCPWIFLNIPTCEGFNCETTVQNNLNVIKSLLLYIYQACRALCQIHMFTVHV